MSSLTSRALLAPVIPKQMSEQIKYERGWMHTHRGTKTSIDFEDGKLVEVGDVLGLGKLSIGDDLIVCW